MSINSKKVIGAFLIGASAFILIGLAWPQYQVMGITRSAISERDEIISDKKELVNTINKLKDEYQSRASDMARLDVLLPKTKNIKEALQDISTIAQQTGLGLASIKTSATEEKNKKDTGPGQVTIETSTEGSYRSLVSFLTELEKNLRITDLDSISLSEGGGEGASNILKMSIKAKGYFIKQDE